MHTCPKCEGNNLEVKKTWIKHISIYDISKPPSLVLGMIDCWCEDCKEYVIPKGKEK